MRGCVFAPEFQRAFVVSGGTFWEVFASGAATSWGTVAVDGNPATLCSNGNTEGGELGNQIFIVSGGNGYIFDMRLNTFVQITDDAFPVPCLLGVFLDGYFVALNANLNSFSWSEPFNGIEWNGVDVAGLSMTTNSVLSLIVNHRELWLPGQATTEVWNNQARIGSRIVFAPISQVLVDSGIAGSFAYAKIDNTHFVVSVDQNGGPIVNAIRGYTPARISTHAIETYLQKLDRIDNAIGFAVQMDGHPWFWLYLPNAQHSLICDVASGLWYKWALWNPETGLFEPGVARCHMFAFGKHLVGSCEDGMLYELSLDVYTDGVVAA